MRHLRLLIPLVLLAGCGASGSDASTTTQPIAEQVSDWNDAYGDSITTLQADLGAIGDAAGTLDPDALSVACAEMGDGISTALDDPPIPDPETNREWRAALTDFADGAEACENGAVLMDSDLISEATDAFSSGTDHLTAATNRLAELAS